MEPFRKEVKNLQIAKVLLVALADYDIFQLEHNVKPDFANASGCEIFNEDEQDWEEWMDEDTGDNIWDVIRADKENERGAKAKEAG